MVMISVRLIISLRGPTSKIYLFFNDSDSCFGAEFKNRNIFSWQQKLACLFNHILNFDSLECRDQCFQLDLSSIKWGPISHIYLSFNVAVDFGAEFKYQLYKIISTFSK